MRAARFKMHLGSLMAIAPERVRLMTSETKEVFVEDGSDITQLDMTWDEAVRELNAAFCESGLDERQRAATAHTLSALDELISSLISGLSRVDKQALHDAPLRVGESKCWQCGRTVVGCIPMHPTTCLECGGIRDDGGKPL